MCAKMQKMMGAIQGKESPDMDELMESMKAEEQVKGISSPDPANDLGHACDRKVPGSSRGLLALHMRG